jgi:hypothetical protein
MNSRLAGRSLESELDDTVPAQRPSTVEDVLSFRFGSGRPGLVCRWGT